MDSLASILPKVLHKRGLHGHARAAHVTFRAGQWIAAALPNLHSQYSVEHLQAGTLTISCLHSIAAQELTPLLPQLKEYLERECKAKVEEIRLMRTKGQKQHNGHQ